MNYRYAVFALVLLVIAWLYINGGMIEKFTSTSETPDPTKPDLTFYLDGCYNDSASSRILPKFFGTGFTILSCTSTAKQNGFDLAGIENGACYGGTFGTDKYTSQGSTAGCPLIGGVLKSQIYRRHPVVVFQDAKPTNSTPKDSIIEMNKPVGPAFISNTASIGSITVPKGYKVTLQNRNLSTNQINASQIIDTSTPASDSVNVQDVSAGKYNVVIVN